jgi:hypothetical protein
MLYDRMMQVEAEAAGRSASAVFRPVYQTDEEAPPGSAAARAGADRTGVHDPVVRTPVTAGSDDPGPGVPPPTAVAAAKSA